MMVLKDRRPKMRIAWVSLIKLHHTSCVPVGTGEKKRGKERGKYLQLEEDIYRARLGIWY
jgi:hypothetical protein